MEQIISNNKLLEQLTCTKCFKYLSILPVKVYPDRSILCGRCVQPEDLGIRSLYCDLVKNIYFKCINHLEGCEVLMKPLQMADHEESCLATKIECPECDLEMDCFFIYKHFKDCHKTQLLKQPKIKISFLENNLQFWIYKCDNFVVLIKIFIQDNTFFLDCIDIGYKKQGISLKYSIEMYDGCKSMIKSEEYNCSRKFRNYAFSSKAPGSLCNEYELVINFSGYFDPIFQQIQTENIAVPEKLTRQIFLSDDFKADHPDWKLTVNKRAIISLNGCITSQGFCSECQYIIGSVALKCQEHGVCNTCYATKNNLLLIYNKLRFYCVWNCGNHFEDDKLYKHENICKSRREIPCPIAGCLRKCSNTDVLQTHFDSAHNQLLLILGDILFVPEIQFRDVIIYFRHTLIDLNVTMNNDIDWLTYKPYKYKVKLNSIRYLLIEENNMFCTISNKINGTFIQINADELVASALVIKFYPDYYFENNIVAEKLTRVIYLTNEFKNLYPYWKLASNQRAIITSKNYITIQGFCNDCQNILASMELKCSENGICNRCTTKKSELLPVYNKLRFYCIWNCDKHFTVDELYVHENFCERRVAIACIFPECFEKMFSNLEDFKNHSEDVHNVSFLNCDKELNFEYGVKSTLIYFRHILMQLEKHKIFNSYTLEYISTKFLFETNSKCKIFNKNGNYLVTNQTELPFKSTLYVKFE